MSSIIESSAPSSPPVMSTGSSRASSPVDLDLTMAETPLKFAQEKEIKGTKHPHYFFEDGSIVFLVEGSLYKIHRYFFARDSAHFRSIFGLKGVEGSDEYSPCILSDVNCADFDEFLAILYPTVICTLSPPTSDFLHPTEKNIDQWTSILHLSAKWGFESIKFLAIDRLTAHAAPIDKIVLGRRYGIDDWLPGSYEAVCMRADPLTMEEGMKLGWEDAIRISTARQVYGCAKPRHETAYLSQDLREIFGLVKPSESEKIEDSDRKEDDAIIILEKEIDAAEMDIPPVMACMNEIVIDTDCWGNNTYGPCRSCPACKPESDEQRLNREVKEVKEKQVKALKETRERRSGERIKQQGRLSIFQ
ncbi:hypothetical protein HWV62_14872 [Athelia sp. TMB]|nr:hypothetical protein HWV62_14872 [Athelia sp. TMB]